jgi:hypothetical protein
MKKKTNKIILVIILIAIAILVYNSQVKKEAQLTSGVQYYNEPIDIKFQTDLSHPSVSNYFNDVLRNDSYTLESNNTYHILLSNWSTEGVYKVVFTTSSDTLTSVTQIKKPYVDAKIDFPFTLNQGDKATLKVKTYSPQGKEVTADEVNVVISLSDNTDETVKLSCSGYDCSKEYTFSKPGQYNYAVHATKVNWDTVEITSLTQVIKSEGIPYIVWMWFIWFGLIIILFIVARIRGKKIGWKKK